MRSALEAAGVEFINIDAPSAWWPSAFRKPAGQGYNDAGVNSTALLALAGCGKTHLQPFRPRTAHALAVRWMLPSGRVGRDARNRSRNATRASSLKDMQ